MIGMHSVYQAMIEKMLHRNVCHDYFRMMAAKGKSKGRHKKVNRAHISKKTKIRHRRNK